MKKYISLIKACMTDNMNLFKIKKKNNKKNKLILPIVLFVFLFFYMVAYCNMLIVPLQEIHLEYIVLTLFIAFTTILTFAEGVYKSSSLLFNCKDDNLLLSLPIKKSAVLFIRIFKFYVFELLYNSLFLVPSMVVYASYVNVESTFYLVSAVAIFLFPIIPIVLSCIIGGFISFSSAKFKHKNIAQTLITIIILLFVFYLSFNLEKFTRSIADKAGSVNDIITKIYYPARSYINLVLNYNLKEFIIFIAIHLAIFVLAIFVFSKLYFKINSSTKVVKVSHNKGNYKIKTSSPIKALIKKELNRFINSPVFVINAAFGMVLYILGCIVASVKFDSIVQELLETNIVTYDQIYSFIPLILFGFIALSCLLSSITSSMISLEGKSFNILKSLPIESYKIIKAKILTAVLIMVPCILIGDIIAFIRFRFNIIEIIMILFASIILPLVAETIGILVNLKYPKMDAESDTEVVKQSMSSMIAVFIGMILSGITIFALIKGLAYNINIDLIILIGLAIYTFIYIVLNYYLKRVGTKKFNKINV